MALKQDSELSIYDLMKDWFNFCFENPELINPNHGAMYFFIIEHNNRLGWKPKFGLPRQMTMDAIGIRNNRTYMKAFTDLVNWGFIVIYQSSVNQYSANVIGLVKNTIATTKALSKATHKQRISIALSTAPIDIPITNIPITKLQEREKKISPPEINNNFNSTASDNLISIDEIEKELLADIFQQEQVAMCHHLPTIEAVQEWIKIFIIMQKSEGIFKKSLKDAKSHFSRWLRTQLERQNNSKQTTEKQTFDLK